MADIKNIKCVVQFNDYYATVNGNRVRFIYDHGRQHVFIYDESRCFGGYHIDRFGGELSPDGIRELFKGVV